MVERFLEYMLKVIFSMWCYFLEVYKGLNIDIGYYSVYNFWVKVVELDSVVLLLMLLCLGLLFLKNGVVLSILRWRYVKVVIVEDESEEYDEDDIESEVEEVEIFEFILG